MAHKLDLKQEVSPPASSHLITDANRSRMQPESSSSTRPPSPSLMFRRAWDIPLTCISFTARKIAPRTSTSGPQFRVDDLHPFVIDRQQFDRQLAEVKVTHAAEDPEIMRLSSIDARHLSVYWICHLVAEVRDPTRPLLGKTREVDHDKLVEILDERHDSLSSDELYAVSKLCEDNDMATALRVLMFRRRAPDTV